MIPKPLKNPPAGYRDCHAAELVLRARADLGAVGTSYYPKMTDLNWLLDEPCIPLWEAYQATGLVCNLQLQPANYPHIKQPAWSNGILHLYRAMV
jgi:hypothetical protein